MSGVATLPPRWLYVDDLDSSIEYEGDGWYTASDSKENFETWDNAGFGLTYLGTLHGVNNDAKMSFTFDGSAVLLTGSNNPLNDSGVVTPSWECFMDGVKFGEQTTFRFPANNWDFCSWPENGRQVAGGKHTLTVEIKTDGQAFFADRIKYVPTPGSEAATRVGEDNVVELSRGDLGIKLGEGWGSLGDTANFTQVNGAKAEVEFYGTRMSWWAFIPGEFAKDPTTGTYEIDGGRPTSFTLRGLEANQPTTYHQMIFQTPSLPKGPHKIVVTYQGSRAVTPLPLTHVLVHNGNATAPRPGDPGVFELATMTSGTAAPSSSAAPGGSGGSSNAGSSPPIGAIVGGVVGGLVVIASIILLLVFLRRRKRRRRDSMPHPVVIPYSPAQEPRPLMEEVHSHDVHPQDNNSSMYTGSSGYHQSSMGASSTSYANAGRGVYHKGGQPSMSGFSASGQSSSAGTSSAAAGGVGAAPAPRGKGGVPPPLASSSRVVLHQDSGLRMDAVEEDNVEELPPVYTAA